MTTGSPTRGRPAGLTGESLVATAREVFLERGYAGASMDEVAKRARISKASLYREHPSKSDLYAAVVRQWAAAGRGAMRPSLERLQGSEDTRQGLSELAETMRSAILSEQVLAMRRLVTAESQSQPAVAAMYLEESWNANIENLAETFRALTEAGALDIDDAHVAAEQFTWLVIGAPLNARLLGGVADSSLGAAAIDLFLARYGPRS